MTEKEVIDLAKKACIGKEVFGFFIFQEDAGIDDLMVFVKLLEERLKNEPR